jgi:hypothetical protein
MVTDYKMARGCIRCGYRTHPNALELHHRDPEDKDLEIHEAVFFGWDRLRLEIEKCDVLCANCHREHHAGAC